MPQSNVFLRLRDLRRPASARAFADEQLGDVVVRCSKDLIEVVTADPRAAFAASFFDSEPPPWMEIDGDHVTVRGQTRTVTYRIRRRSGGLSGCAMRIGTKVSDNRTS